MKIALLIALLAFSPSANGQNNPDPKDHPSSNDIIRADRAKMNALEENQSKKRPWDRDAEGKRPWDRKQAAPTKE
jgi:hypothetical protein